MRIPGDWNRGAAGELRRECVILLHGLCRTARSMGVLRSRLEAEGYLVVSPDYPSRTASIAKLSATALPSALAEAREKGGQVLHFVTHSLGGILVRHYLSSNPIPDLGKVVMLGPPNQGSEVVDRLRGLALFRWLNGPAGGELGTGPDSTPNQLGPVNYPVGVVAGNRSINWINSLFISGADDGKVSVIRTQVEGMTDQVVVPVAHPFLMKHPAAIAQVICFLRTEKFDHSRSNRCLTVAKACRY